MMPPLLRRDAQTVICGWGELFKLPRSSGVSTKVRSLQLTARPSCSRANRVRFRCGKQCSRGLCKECLTKPPPPQMYRRR